MNQPPLNPDALEAAADAVAEVAEAAHVKTDWLDDQSLAKAAVSAYLAVAQPEVTNIEELEALSVGSVVLDDDGATFAKWAVDEWYQPANELPYSDGYIALPARVLDLQKGN